jgi:hypothetical protein
MAAKAQEISLEAGSKMAAAMKDVISAAAGISGFAIESARDLVQYMVRRGQMTQDEADKLIREAEGSDSARKPHPVPPPSRVPKPPPVVRTEVGPPTMVAPMHAPPRPVVHVEEDEEEEVAAPRPPAKKAAPPKPAPKKKAKAPVAKAKGGAKTASKKKTSGRR